MMQRSFALFATNRICYDGCIPLFSGTPFQVFLSHVSIRSGFAVTEIYPILILDIFDQSSAHITYLSKVDSWILTAHESLCDQPTSILGNIAPGEADLVAGAPWLDPQFVSCSRLAAQSSLFLITFGADANTDFDGYIRLVRHSQT